MTDEILAPNNDLPNQRRKSRKSLKHDESEAVATTLEPKSEPELTPEEPLQFSLALYDSKPDILKKPVQAVHMAVVKGQLNRNQLLAWNVMLRNAFEWHAKHGNEEPKEYMIPRTKLMKEIGYTSPNRAYLKSCLTAMQDVKVSWDTLQQDGGKKWEQTVLMPRVGFDDEYVYYQYDRDLKIALLDARTYSRLNIAIQRQFSTHAAAALYEWCNRFRNNPSQLTNQAPWQDWRSAIYGPTEKGSTMDVYKYFKTRKLGPAIAEINAISDLQIDLIETKVGRRVKNLQFRVRAKEPLPSENTLVQQSDWHIVWDAKLKMLKVPLKDRKRILASFNEEQIEANYRYTQRRMEDASQPKLVHPGKYFIRAIEDGFANAPEPATGEPKASGSDISALQAEFDKARTTEAIEMFNEMTDDQQLDALQKYNEFVGDKSLAILDDDARRSNRLMVPFYGWLARTTWPKATVQELLDFAVKKGMIELKI